MSKKFESTVITTLIMVLRVLGMLVFISMGRVDDHTKENLAKDVYNKIDSLGTYFD